MSIAPLIDIIHSGMLDKWPERNQSAFAALFGSPEGRYGKAAEGSVTLRAPKMSSDAGVVFAAYIHPMNATSGSYSGLSFVIFPVQDEPCLIGLVVGTGGLAPDEAILGRPGHARKVQAICSWLNSEFGSGARIAWAKQDPTRIDVSVPADVGQDWQAYHQAFGRYGKEMYALFRPTGHRVATTKAVTAFLDLLFEERGHAPLAACRDDSETIKHAWFERLMPSVETRQVKDLLTRRRYVIVQGPPGTGKTTMATSLLQQDYGGRGQSIQFHPNTTYESFVGGLAPANAEGELGLRFQPTPGFLMQAAIQARSDPSRNYLLHIDEINRTDLGKILGEAIFLMEVTSDAERRIELPYDFGEPFHRALWLPKNLHILGTMNSADRSIALVDVAVRRRFAFVSLWPSMSVVQEHGCLLMQDAFLRLVQIFVEHASDDSFPLVPGHSYFLEKDEKRAKENLHVHLEPLLEEYLAQGYVGGFAEPIRSYLQWLRSL